MKAITSKRKRLVGVLLVLALTFVGQALVAQAAGSDVNWIGGTGSWSVDTNWQGGSAPGLNDTAVINQPGANVTVDTTVDVRNLRILDGAVDGNGQTLYIAGDLTVSGAGASFDTNGGLLVIDGGGHSVVTISSTATFDDLQLLKTDNRMNLTVSGTMDVGGDLTIGDGVHASWGISLINGDTIDVAGDVITYDTTVGGTGTVKLNGPDHTIDGGGRLPVVDIASGETEALSDFGVTDLIVSGKLDAEGKQVSVSRDLTVNNGGELYNSTGAAGMLKIDGGGHSVATIDGGATTSFFDILIDKSDNRMYLTVDGTLELENDLTIEEISRINGGEIVVGGDVHTNDPSVGGTATILPNGPGHTVYGDGDLPDLKVTTGTTTISGDVGVENLSVLTGGVLNAGGRTLGIARNFTVGGGTFNHDNGTIVFDEGGHSVVSIGTTKLNNVVLAKTDNRMWLQINSDLDVNGDLTITQVSAIKGTVRVAGNVSTSDTSLSQYHGLIIMDGGKVHQNLSATAPNAQVPDLEIAKTDSRYNVNVSGTVTVNEDLTVTQVGSINGPGTIKVLGNVYTTDNAVGGDGTVLLNGDHDITTDGDGGELPNLLVSDGTTDASSAPYLSVQDMTVSGDGEFIAPSPGTLGIADDFSVGSTFTAGSGTVELNGHKTHQTVAIGTAQLNNLTIAKTDSRYNMEVVGVADALGDLTVTQVGSINGGTIKVGGHVATTDDAVGGGGTVELNGSHNITTPDGQGELPNLLISGGTTDASSAGFLGVQDMTVSGGGTFIAPSPGTLGIAGDFTVNSAFTPGSGTVKFDGGKTNQLVDINEIPLNDVVIAKTDGRYKVQVIAGDDLDVNGDFTLTKGIFVAPGTVFVAGNFTYNGGSFVQSGTGLLHFDPQTPFRGATSRSVTINNSDLSIEDVQFGGYGNGGSGSKVTYNISGAGKMIVTKDLTIQQTGSALAIVLNGGTIEAHDVTVGPGAAGGTTQIVMTGSIIHYTAGRMPHLVVRGTVNMDGTDLAVQDFTLESSGTFNAPSHEMKVNGSFTVQPGGTLNPNNGTVHFDPRSPFRSATDRNIDVDGSLTLHNLRYGGYTNGGSGSRINYVIASGDTLALTGNLTIEKESGTGSLAIAANGGSIQASDVTVGPGAAGGTTQVVMSGSTIHYTGGRMPHLVVAGSVDVDGSALAVQDFTLKNGGTFTAPSGDTKVNGNFIVEGGTYNHGNGTLHFDATSPFRSQGTRTIDIPDSPDYTDYSDENAKSRTETLTLNNLRYGGYGNGGSGSLRYVLGDHDVIRVNGELRIEKTGGGSVLGIYADGGTIKYYDGFEDTDYAGGTTVIVDPPGDETCDEEEVEVTIIVDAPDCCEDDPDCNPQVDIYGYGTYKGDGTETITVPKDTALSHRARASGLVGDWQTFSVDEECGDDCTATLMEDRFSCVTLAVSTPECWESTGAMAEVDIYGQGNSLKGETLCVPTGVSLSRRARASGLVGDWKTYAVPSGSSTLTEDRFSCVTLTVDEPDCWGDVTNGADAEIDIYGQGNELEGEVLGVPTGISLSRRARASNLVSVNADWLSESIGAEEVTLTEDRYSCVTLAVDAPPCCSDAEIDIYGQGNELAGDILGVPTDVDLSRRARANGKVEAWLSEPVDAEQVTLTEDRFDCMEIQLADRMKKDARVTIYGVGTFEHGDEVCLPTSIDISWRLEVNDVVCGWNTKHIDGEALEVDPEATVQMPAGLAAAGAKVNIRYDSPDVNLGNDDTFDYVPGKSFQWQLKVSGFTSAWKTTSLGCDGILEVTTADYCHTQIQVPDDLAAAGAKVNIRYDSPDTNYGDDAWVYLPTGLTIQWQLKVSGFTSAYHSHDVDCDPCDPLVVTDVHYCHMQIQMPDDLAAAGAKVNIRYDSPDTNYGDNAWVYLPKGLTIQWQLKVSGFTSGYHSHEVDCAPLVVGDAHYCHTQIQMPDDLAAVGAKVNIRYDSPDTNYGDDTWVYLPTGLTIQWQLKVSGFTSGYHSHEVDCDPLVVGDAHYFKMQIQIRNDVAGAGGKVNIRYDSPDTNYGDDEYVYLPKSLDIQWQLKVNGLTCGYYTKHVDDTHLTVDPEAEVQGLPDGGKVDIQNGPQNLGNDGTFDYVPGQNFNWRADANGFSGAWNTTSLGCDGVLQAGTAFCSMTITGVPTGAKVDIQNGPQNQANDAVVTLPANITIKWRADASGFSGGWNDHSVGCCNNLDASNDFCDMQITGVPSGAKVDIQNGPQNQANDAVVTLPANITIKWRADASGFSGGWKASTHPVVSAQCRSSTYPTGRRWTSRTARRTRRTTPW